MRSFSYFPFLYAVTLLTLVSHVAACSCIRSSFAEQFNLERNTGVFKVTVLEKFFGKDGVKGGRQDELAWQDRQILYHKVDVKEAFKGCDSPPELLADTLVGTSCTLFLEVGKTYLVMVGSGKIPSIGPCYGIWGEFDKLSKENLDYLTQNRKCGACDV